MLKFLALGDSYTVGEGVSADECWPAQLTAALRQYGLPLDAPNIIARTGWTAGELRAAKHLFADISDVYDLVSLQIGVNDQYRGYAIGGYKREFEVLLAEAIELAGGEAGNVMVLSIPDWGVTPYAQGRDRRRITAEINLFNLAIMENAHSAGVHYVDVTPASRQAGRDVSFLALDGLHPSAKMYTIWVELILPVALKILI